MTFFYRLLAALTLTVLAACTNVPQSEPCPNPDACTLAELMVQGFGPSIGEDFGGGVILANVTAAGSLVVIDIQVPLPGAGMEDVQRRTLHDVTSQGFVQGFCSDAEAQDLFSFGNAYQIRTLGTDGVVLGASTIRSCRG